MKKLVVIISLGIALCSAIALTVFSIIKLNNENKLIDDINKKIVNVENSKEKIITENENYKKEIEDLKVELKDKIEEEEIWNETIEKLNQALS